MIQSAWKGIVGIFIVCNMLLTGCSVLNNASPNDPRFAPAYPEIAPAPSAKNGSIYQAGHAMSLYTDRIARRVGDIITVRLEEQTDGTKKAKSKVDKKSNLLIATPTIFGKQFEALNQDMSSDNKFEGNGESNQSNKLNGTITVTVSRVLPNGNMLIGGESWITINNGREYIRLTGMVRADDISSKNEVSSQRIANARISYSHTGQIADANRQPWLTRFFNMIWPF